MTEDAIMWEISQKVDLEEKQLDTITAFRRTGDAIDELFQHT